VSAASAADGLARAVLERSADALLLGWGSSDRSARNSPFAHDALARATPAMIVSVRYPQAFRTARRLVVVLPSQCQDNPNTEAALSTAARAWGKSLASAEPWILGESGRDTVSHPAFGAKKTRCVRQWRDLPTSIKADAGTAFAIIASRPGSAGWSPGTERLSVILEDAFPKSALCLFYLTDMQTEADKPNPEDTRPGSEEPSLPPLVLDAHKAGRIRANMSEAALVDAVRELAGAIFTDNRGAATALSRELSSIARREPIELEPGVLLLHAHVGALSAPVLAMGARQEGWPLTALSQRVKVLVMLCSPADAPPSMHLQALTELAAALRAQALQHLFPGIDAN
ncbi:MAG TPA: hypothetical protein PLC54_04635, partial [Spirochaetales bacterium]|nr:hypothetical protein [Spirochaetales bacterium]